MANVKLVIIRGTMTFNASNADGSSDRPNQNALALLGQLSLPTFGLKIKFGATPVMVPNKCGGKTAMFNYEITGKEAVATAGLQAMLRDLKQVGIVLAATSMDIENNAPAENLLAA